MKIYSRLSPVKPRSTNYPLLKSNPHMKNYDLIVIGAGAGGFSAAETARSAGIQKILLVEKREIGYSLCTNKGCMPSKTLLASKRLGLNWPEAQKRVRDLVSNNFFASRKKMIEASGFEILKGEVKFISPREIEVSGATYRARNFVIAVGSEVFIPSVKGLDEAGYITSDEALFLDEAPKSLIIIGGGYVACEMASIFNSMNSKVAIHERGDRLLKRLDKELGLELGKAFKKRGIELNFGQDIKAIRDIRKNEETILLAVGRRPAVANLDLERADVRLDGRGAIEVNDYLQTSQDHIYAVGDSNARAPLVYAASMEGRIAGQHIAGGRVKMNYSLVGLVIFSHPEIGSLGLSEEEARRQELKIEVSKIPMADIGKAVAIGETEGFVKMIVLKKSGQLLGLHIIGPLATDIIQVALPHFYHGDTVFDIMNIPWPHPTLGEALSYSAEELVKRLNIFKKNAVSLV